MALTVARRAGGFVQALRLGAPQNVTIGGFSHQSTAFAASTEIIRIVATVACWIEVGLNPTATDTKTYLPAGVVEYLNTQGGWKIAALQAASAGTLNVTEIV